MNNTAEETIVKTDFGAVDNQPVYLFTFTNKEGNKVCITNYGGIVTKWLSADKNGNKSSIVIGFENLESYLPNDPSFGALVGRYANRIAGGKFRIDNKEYTLARNNGENHLHGGIKNFCKVVWTPVIDNNTNALLLSYLSKDGEEGYPGNLSVNVTYRFTNDNELIIEYTADTDKPTVINLTSHCYFNLTGDVNNDVLEHTIRINADKYTPVNIHSIPTGEINAVNGSEFDLTTPKKIGDKIRDTEEGYDHNYVLNDGDITTCAAAVTDEISGRQLEVYTDQPGVQFYTGNFLDGTYCTADGSAIRQHTGFCLETQHFPDSPNKPNFPTTVLRPGERYYTATKYKLSIQ